MVTKLGRGVYSEITLKNSSDQGIDTTHVLFDDARFSGVAPIFVDDDAENFIVIVPGANSDLTPAIVQPSKQLMLKTDILISQLEIPLETTLEAFRIAKNGSVRTILNPAPAAPIPQELLQLSDICSPSETNTELLPGQPVDMLAEAESAARKLLSQVPGTVILTMGERGALLVDKDSVEHIPAINVAALDPTGAGDAFVGNLAVFLDEGFPLRDTILCTIVVVALSVTRLGTKVSFPKREEMDGFQEQQGLV